MSSKSAQISALVAQLKNGLITKHELFESLQRLQHGGSVDVNSRPAVEVRLGVRTRSWVLA